MNFFSQGLTPARRTRLLKRIAGVVDREQFIAGPEVAELETRLGKMFGREVLTCNSGTDALLLGLRALGIGPGDEVITTAFTYFATIEAIASVGATPVLVDIDPQTFNIDPALIEAKVTRRTKAVLIVHLYGLSCDMPPILAVCRARKLKLIEDCAQSFAARGADGRLTGTYGDIGCFSFFPTKNLGAFGDGGAVTVRSSAAAERFRRLRNHGQIKKYVHDTLGVNSRLDTLQAAILLEKLEWLDDDLSVRKRRAAAWIEEMKDRDDVLSLPAQTGHTYNVFTVTVRDREAFVRGCEKRKIQTAIYYDRPVYLQNAYVRLFGKHRRLPHAEFAATHVVSLPIH